MTIFEMLHIANIMAIIFFTAYLCKMIAKMKYGLYRCVIRWWFYGDYEKMAWLWSRKYYILCYPLILFFIYLCLGLINQLNFDTIYIRKEETIAVSIVIWLLTTALTFFMHSKLREYEKE